MDPRRTGFESELLKLANAAPVGLVSNLRMPRAPVVRPGSFGIKDAIKTSAVEPETMSRPKWMQTLVDMPASIGAMALGYGIGRAATDAYIAHSAKTTPHLIKYAPAAAATTGAIAMIGMQAIQAHMRARRAQAEQEKKVVL